MTSTITSPKRCSLIASASVSSPSSPHSQRCAKCKYSFATIPIFKSRCCVRRSESSSCRYSTFVSRVGSPKNSLPRATASASCKSKSVLPAAFDAAITARPASGRTESHRYLGSGKCFCINFAPFMIWTFASRSRRCSSSCGSRSTKASKSSKLFIRRLLPGEAP